MAQLTLDLAQFKSAGVYTLEIDDTVQYRVETNALRLLVGFSAKGPFNKPVFLRDQNDAATIFGPINEKLEHKGSFFNRFADTLAKRTPVFALNLLKVDETVQGLDQVNYAAMSLDAGTPNPEVSSYNKAKYGQKDNLQEMDKLIYANAVLSQGIPYVGNAPYASFFDRSRFWEPSDENLLANAANGVSGGLDTTTFENTNFLNFANVGTEEFSILVFKPENLTGYSLTCEEWYGGNIPYGFIRPNDYVEDYFIQVVAVKGNWTDYAKLSNDALWKDFFDANGIKKGKINSFLSAEGVTLLGSWIGSIIPGFQNKNGEFVDIISKINNNTTVTGLLASFNKDAAQVLAFDYDGKEDEEGNIDPKTRGWFIDADGDGEWNTGESAATRKTFKIDMLGHNFQDGYATGAETPSGENDDENEPILVPAIRYGVNFLSYNYDSDSIDKITEHINSARYFNECGVDASGNNPVKKDIKNLFILTDQRKASMLATGDLVNNDKSDLKLIPGLTRITKKVWVSLEGVDVSAAKDRLLTNASEVSLYKDGGQVLTADSVTRNVLEVENATFVYNGTTYTYTGKAIYDEAFGKVGFYLYTTIEGVEITKDTQNGDYVMKQNKISDSVVSSNLKFIPLKGLKIGKRHMPGYDENGIMSKEGGIEKIYSVLSSAGILRGLCNPQMIQFRYVIDSMSGGIAPMMGGKVYISQLAMKKGKTTALLNAPSKREFARSTNPYFCASFVNGVDIKPPFSTEYVAKGGNDELYGENIFSLPDEDNGGKKTGVFWPNLIYSVGGKKVSVPPAADVANVLIRKYTGSDPWMICANNNGVISNDDLYGLEYEADQTDRDYLEPMGINTIISRDGNVMIYGNQTCYQRVVSDYNKFHIIENLHTLEIAVDAILQNYVFLYNNAQTRADIIQKVTPIFQAAQTSGAIDDFKLICDESNNTEELIAQDFGILECQIVFGHGMEKILSIFRLKRKIS